MVVRDAFERHEPSSLTVGPITDVRGESRLGNGELARRTLTGGAVDLFAQQVGVTGVARVLLDHVADEPPQTHPTIGSELKTSLSESAGDRVARAMHRPHPQVAERLGIVVLRRLPSPRLPRGFVVDALELGQQGRTHQAGLELQLLTERQVLEKSTQSERGPTQAQLNTVRVDVPALPGERPTIALQGDEGSLDLVAMLEDVDVPLRGSSGREPGRARKRRSRSGVRVHACSVVPRPPPLRSPRPRDESDGQDGPFDSWAPGGASTIFSENEQRREVEPMDATVQVWLGERGADEGRLDLLHRQLRAQLDDVTSLDASLGAPAAVPDGARGLDAATVSTLAVALLGSGGLTALLASVRDWLGRGHAAPRTVRLEIAGDVIELTGADEDEQDELVDLFLARHETQGSQGSP